MTETLDVKTFDLAEVLAGRKYPELEVPVYFNEQLGFAIKTLRDGIRVAELSGEADAAEKLHAQLTELVQQVEAEKYIVSLRAVPSVVKTSILSKALEAHPTERDIFGREKLNLEQDLFHSQLLWAAMITKITDPSGAETFVDEEAAKSLSEYAPPTVSEAISEGIKELNEGAKSGFEYAAQELDFLSSASREG